jgi:hypothetical protein
MRVTIRRAVRDLGSDDDQALDEAILLIAQLLDQEHQLASYEWALQHPSWLMRLPADYKKTRPSQIRDQHEWALPPSLLGRRMQAGEMDAVRKGLLELLDRGKKTASIIFAFGKSGGQDVIPRIIDELRRQMGRDAWTVHQAVYTLDNLLYVPAGQRRLTKKQARIFHQACLAIGEAATFQSSYPPRREPGYVPDPRESAVQTLAVLCLRFTPRRRLRGLPRRRGDEYLAGLVEETRVLPSGDVLVHGPLRANLNQPQLQVHVRVDRPDGSTSQAVFVGPHFDVSTWPPKQSIVLRGVLPSDVPRGTQLFASGEEQAEISTGRAAGELRLTEMFGHVHSAVLPPGEFMMVNKTPDEVRIPEFSAERAAIWERTQAKLEQWKSAMRRPRKSKAK